MLKKRHNPEEIVAKLRQVDVLTSQGKSVADAIRTIGVTEVTYYRWRQEFGGLKSDQVERLKNLEAENARLRPAVSDLTLGQDGPGRGCPGKLLSPSRRRACIDHVRSELRLSERRICRVLGQHRSTQCPNPTGPPYGNIGLQFQLPSRFASTLIMAHDGSARHQIRIGLNVFVRSGHLQSPESICGGTTALPTTEQ
jgi:putative transposase